MKIKMVAAWIMGAIGFTGAGDSFADMTTQADFLPEEFASSRKLDVGVHLGAGVLSQGGGTNLGYGITAGYRLSPYWGVAASFDRVDRGTVTAAETGSLEVDAALNFYTVEANYFLDSLPGLQFGAKAGLGSDRLKINGTSTTSTNFYYGPRVAYDYMLGGGVSVGGEGNVLLGTGSDTKNATQLLGVVKIWI
jgi:hypothetical protein